MKGSHSRVKALAQSSVAVVVVSAATRVALWAVGLSNPASFQSPDTADYWALADQPLSTYAMTSGELYEAGLRRPPGYPLLLALFRIISDEVVVAALLQTTFAIAIVFLVVTLGRTLLGVREALVAGWWLALDPLHSLEASMLLTEIPFSFLLLIATLAAAKALGSTKHSVGWWAVVGGALGFATLVRPISYYLPVIVCPVVVVGLRRLLGWRSALVRGATVLAGFLAFVGPWIARNAMVSGVPTISTVQGVNLAYYRGAGALVEGSGLPLPTASLRVYSIVEARLPPSANSAVRSRVQGQVGVEVILAQPLGYTISALKGAGRTLLGPGGADIESRTRHLPGGRWLFGGLWALSGASALACSMMTFVGLAWLAHRRDWELFALLALPIAYLLIVGSGLESYSRFRLPMLPSMTAAAAIAVIALYDRARARRSPRRGAPAI